MKKRILSAFLVLAMVLTLIPAMSFAASAEDLEPVKYIDRTWDGEKVVDTEKVCTDYVLVDEDTSIFDDGKWYVVNGEFASEHRIMVTGEANLILCDDCSFTVNGGIYAPTGNTLNIYGGPKDSGMIYATGPVNAAGIGGNTYIYGGTINIEGGIVYAIGGSDAAGIGGGYSADGGNVTVLGGTVIATAGNDGAAIGGGYKGYGGNFAVYGGIVYAFGGIDGRAIGAGNEGENDGTIKVTEHTRIKAGDTAPGNETTLADYLEKGYKYISVSALFADYIERSWDGEKIVETPKTCWDFVFVDEDTNTFENGKWYVVKGDITNESVNVSGTANLILCDGASYTLNGGLVVSSGNTLNIYGQSGDSGVLYSAGDLYNAGIGGNNYAHCGTVNIFGGAVHATGAEEAAGIGGGYDGDGGNITVYGGTVTAVAKKESAGIGGGHKGDGGNLTVYGGSVAALGADAAGIGAGYEGLDDGTVTVAPNAEIHAGDYAPGTQVIVDEYIQNRNKYVNIFFPEPMEPFTYIERTWDGEKIVETECECAVFFLVDENTTTFEDGRWYAVKSNVTINSRIEVEGAANLILCDGVTLTANEGIEVSEDNTLNIFGQSGDSGRLMASSLAGFAAIGGGPNKDGGTVIINGGTVNANAFIDGDEGFDAGASGIGGGISGNGGTVIICGGNVSAIGSWDGAGIGGGWSGTGGNITVNGGNVTAKAGYNAAAIGGGADGAGNNIAINGGNVTAIGNENGAGIGGGLFGDGGNITINGGTVNATGGSAPGNYGDIGGAGIGGGVWAAGGNVTISGGNVTAIGGDNAAGIGGDYSYGHGTLTLGEDVFYRAGENAENITVTGDGKTASDALGKNYFYAVKEYEHSGGTATCQAKATCEICGEEYGDYGEHSYGSNACTICGASAFVIDADGKLTGYLGDGGDVMIPNGVTSIGNAVFYGRDDLTSVIIPESVMSIGEGAFQRCTILASVTLSEGVKEIGNSAFAGCRLTSITIPKSVTSIGDSAFYCATLRTITVTDSVQSVGKSIFRANWISAVNYPCGNDIETIKSVYGDYVLRGTTYNAIHDYSEKVLVRGATCTEAAVYENKCVGCDSVSGTIEVGEALGHTWTEATCTEPKNCSVCHVAEGEPLGHSYVIDSKGVAKCKRCSATPPAANITTNIDSCNIAVGDIIKAGVVINPYENDYDAYMATTVDGKFVGVFTPYKKYTAPTCLKCVSKSSLDNYGNFDIEFESACLYTEATCQTPATCIYCGATKGEIGTHNFENGVCTVCGVGIFEFDAKSLALDSALAFKFKGYLHDPNPAADAYMEFKIGNIRTVNVPLNNAVKDEKGRYVFTCYLNVLEVDEKIEAIFHDGEVSVERENPLSVTDYFDKVLDNHKNGTAEDTVIVNLVNAISNYAHYAQIALDETHTEYEVGNGGKYVGTDARTAITLHIADELKKFEAKKTIADGFTDVTATSRSLVLDDETAIVIYITPANDSYIPSVNVTDKKGDNVAVECDKQANGKWRIVIRGIAAHMLADNYTVNIDDGKLTYTNLSALSYAYSILSGSKSEAYKNAVSALYDYYLATKAYLAPAKKMTAIAVERMPDKTEYDPGEELDLTGGRIKVVYDEGTEEIVSMTDPEVTVSDFEPFTAGEKTLTVFYKGKDTMFTLTVKRSEITAIVVKELPSKIEYRLGEMFDPTGIVIMAIRSDGTQEILPTSEVHFSGFDSFTAGEKRITAMYERMTADFLLIVKEKEIMRIEIDRDPNKTVYFVGEELVLIGGRIKVVYDEGTEEIVDMTNPEVTVSGFDSIRTNAAMPLTVAYKGNTAVFIVTVEKKSESLDI